MGFDHLSIDPIMGRDLGMNPKIGGSLVHWQVGTSKWTFHPFYPYMGSVNYFIRHRSLHKLSLSFDGSHREPGDEPVKEKIINDGHGYGHDDGRCQK
jgi:hypothetical protein